MRFVVIVVARGNVFVSEVTILQQQAHVLCNLTARSHRKTILGRAQSIRHSHRGVLEVIVCAIEGIVSTQVGLVI